MSALAAVVVPGQGSVAVGDVVSTTAALVRERFLDEATAERAASLILQRLAEGSYADLSAQQMADQLTADLRLATGDLHFDVIVDPEQFAYLEQGGEDRSPTPPDERLIQARRANFGFTEVSILPGNVGYLKLDTFSWEPGAAEKAHAVMAFLADADAVILDLRDNGGGWASMERLISSYFLPYDGELPLLRFTERAEGTSKEVWMVDWLPQERLTGGPMYVLTSDETFSAAEGVAYQLAVRGRARIVGERSAGGANGVQFVPVCRDFVLKIPTVACTVPLTGSSWEGTGVEVDHPCDAGDALERAHLLALEALLEDVEPERRAGLALLRDHVAGERGDIALDAELLQTFSGVYGGQTVAFRDGALWFQPGGEDSWHRMIPLEERTFMVEGRADFKVSFEDVDGGVAARVFLADGRMLLFERQS